MSEVGERLSVLGVPVDLVEDYTQCLISRLQESQGGHVVTLNAEMTMQAETNPELARIVENAELVVPDGAGVVLYLRLRGRKVKRCPGIELAERTIERSSTLATSQSIFLYGGQPGVAQTAARNLQQRYPDIASAGVQHGYLSPDEALELQNTLKELQPSLILVGLGVPRQEFWIAEHRHLCPNSLWIGVGGSFDIWAGVKTRAPAWLGNLHLEWAYRLYQEPWRWRRMLALPKFALKALAQQ
ncbi:MAG: WecB/TagA/CpsF family glycosyltransferase [Cyanobacteriota bacterium]|nr:WecB/TagA/CpsF family glycosyltransferase [Cyanobacteriota bacterium]